MKARLYYDISRLIASMLKFSPTDIDRVDIQYARYFIKISSRFNVEGVYYCNGVMTLISQEVTRRLVDLLYDNWIDKGVSKEIYEIEVGILTVLFKEELLKKNYSPNRPVDVCLMPLACDDDARIYLNVGFFYGEELGDTLKDIKTCTRLKMVFLVHDLLPIEFPEYFPTDESHAHINRINNIASNADLVIPLSEDLSHKLTSLLSYLSINVRISSPIRCGIESHYLMQSLFLTKNYAPKNQFIVIGDIQPRKNHLMLLEIWRDFLAMGLIEVPQLYLVGSRESGDQNVIDFLDRCLALKPFVVELSSISDSLLIERIKESRAALFPSQGERWGFSAAEAMALGVPTICSDIEVLREATLGKAIYLQPNDYVRWKDTILEFVGFSKTQIIDRHREVEEFHARNWDESFTEIEEYIFEVTRTIDTSVATDDLKFKKLTILN